MASVFYFNFVLLCLFHQVLTIVVPESVASNSKVDEEATSFIEAVHKVFLDNRPIYSITHDYEDMYPLPIVKLLNTLQDTSSVSLYGLQSSDNYTDGKYWFSWCENYKQIPRGNFVFHLIIFREKNYDQVIMKAAVAMQFLTDQQHYFIFYQRDGSPDYYDMFTNDRAFRLKYKIGLSYSNGTILIDTLCFYCDMGAPELLQVGKYTEETGLTLTASELFPDFTRDLNSKFIVGTYLAPVLLEDVLYKRQKLIPMYMYDSSTIDYAKYMNFHFISVPYEHAEATEIEVTPGKWTGQSGAIVHQYADLGSIKTNSLNFLEVGQYPQPLVQDYLGFVTRTPKPAYSWNAITKPYGNDMWIGIMCAGFIFSFVFWGHLTVISKFHNPFPGDTKPSNFLLYSMRYLFSTLMEENPPMVPDSLSARCFLMFWWLFSLVIICGYESKLISFLANPEMEDLPSDLLELANWKKWDAGMSDMHKPYFRVLTNPKEGTPMKKLENNLLSAGTLEDCLVKSVYEDFSCITVLTFLKMFSYMMVDREGTIPLALHGEGSYAIYLSTIFDKQNLLIQPYNRITLYMYASGIVQKYTNDYDYGGMVTGLRKARAENRIYTRSLALNVKQMSGAFYGVAIFGWVGPFFLFLREIYTYKIESRKNKRHGKKLY